MGAFVFRYLKMCLQTKSVRKALLSLMDDMYTDGHCRIGWKTKVNGRIEVV